MSSASEIQLGAGQIEKEGSHSESATGLPQLQMPVQNQSASFQVGDDVPSASSHLGQSAQSSAAESNSQISGSDQSGKKPNSFWQLSATELLDLLQSKIQALKDDIDSTAILASNLSTQTLLDMWTVESKDDIYFAMGIDPKKNSFKALLLENFLIAQTISDSSVPDSIRNYWTNFKSQKFNTFNSGAEASAGGKSSRQNSDLSTPIVNKKLSFIALEDEDDVVTAVTPKRTTSMPKQISIPGVANPMTTPSFYKHIAESSNSFFHMLDNSPAQLSESTITQDAGGNFKLSVTMMPAAIELHSYPTLTLFSKLTVPDFLLKYKIAKLGASKNNKKSLKECINPLLFSAVAKACGVTLQVFQDETDDKAIYAGMLKKFGPSTSDEAMAILKELVFKFDDSKTPQEYFVGALQAHFTQFREQLSQFLYCTFEEGEDLTPEACMLCLTDNFLHNPWIKGPNGNQVRQSSNNAIIIEKIKLYKQLPIHEIMTKIETHFEKEDKVSVRKGYTVKPWVKSSGPPVRNGGIHKQNQRELPNIPRCCKCGRFHAPTAETCLMYDHPSAGKDDKWPPNTKPLSLESPEVWKQWLEEKKKTQPKLVEDFLRKSSDKKSQGGNFKGKGHHGGGKPPLPPRGQGGKFGRNNGGKFVNKTQCAAFQNIGAVSGGENESDGEQHGHVDHATSEDEYASQPETQPTVTLDQITEGCFEAIGHFRKGRTATGKKFPAGRRTKSLRVLMDPGSQGNFIRESALNDGRFLILNSSEEIKCQITQNEEPMGDVCRKCVQLQFHLQLLRKTEIKNVDWFIVSPDIKYDVVLGTKFCREQGYTSFHSTLMPWNRREPGDGDEHVSLDEPKQNPTRQDTKSAHSCSEDATDDDRPTFTDEEIKEKQKEFDESMAVVPPEMFERYGSKHPVTHRPIMRNPNIAPPTSTLHRGAHASVDNLKEKQEECNQILAEINFRHHCKTVKVISENLKAQESFASAEEAENAQKAERMAAADAENFFRDNERYLQPKETFVPNKKHARFYEPVSVNIFALATPPLLKKDENLSTRSHKRFGDNQMVLLKDLVNHAELNGVPARVMSYDEDTSKYTISISKPRGYWIIDEKFMQSIEQPKKNKADLGPTDLGIDEESGQPTLDPLQRPVHRQYGNFVSLELSARISILLETYKQIFSTDVTEPCDFTPMKIKLKPNAVLPHSARLWKNSPLIRAEIRRQLQKMIDMKIVTKSTSAVVSNVLMVKRPGMPGKYRFTVDFRAINEQTASEQWQMPDVQDQLSRLKGKQIFGCVDASSYYHQIGLHKDCRYLTGFITEDGVYEYARVPMGVKNACAHAQRELQMRLDECPILRKYGIRNYFDDIPLAADTPDEFIELLTALFELASRCKLKFNLEKSIFGVDSITHCGFIVSGKGVEIDPMRTESIRSMEEPKSLKKVQAVLGTLNYVRHFIKDFSTLAKPLTDLLSTKSSKHRHFCWNETCSKAFYALKQAALDAPLLEIIDFSKEVFIRSDSSQFGQGAVLFQYDNDGREHVVAYASRKFSLSERNWATFQQEASAIVWALEKFHEFIGGHPVTVQTDHKNLSWISKSIMPQLTRWRLRLQDFDFHVEFIPGRLNTVSDGLSRLKVDDADIPISMRDFLPPAAAAMSLLNEMAPMRCLNNYHVGSVKHGQSSKTISELIWEGKSVIGVDDDDGRNDSAAPVNPQHDEHIRNMMDHADDEPAAIEADEDSDGDEEVIDAARELPNIPPLQQPEQLGPDRIKHIIESVHGDVVGHNGTYVSLQRILKHKQSWASRSQMLADIDQFISGCPTCQKFRKRRNTATNQRFFIEGSPFSEVSVDILNLPKKDCYGNAYVVMIVDTFTRFCFAVPVPDKTAINAGRALMQSIGIFGAPITIRSDGGGEFVGDVIKSIEVMTGINHHRIQPYLHTGNGIVERANRSVLEYMRTLIFDKRLEFNGEHMWSDVLPMACRIVNASFHSSIGCSPASLLFGDNVDLDRGILSRPPPPARREVLEYTEQLSRNQRHLLEISEEYQDKVHARNLAKWRQTQKPNDLLPLVEQSGNAENQTVHWVVAKVQADMPHNKLKPRWTGPFIMMGFKPDSSSMVMLWDTVDKKVREAPINNIAEWKCDFIGSAEGLTHIRETDYADLAYPMEAILGVALDPKDDEVEPIPLDANYVRAKPKDNYLFSVKWRGYHEPTWRPYRVVKRTSLFPLFAASRPNLNL